MSVRLDLEPLNFPQCTGLGPRAPGPGSGSDNVPVTILGASLSRTCPASGDRTITPESRHENNFYLAFIIDPEEENMQ